MDDRLRRSLLYVPASSEAMLRKAPSRGADAIIVDLEDGVLPDAKEGARARAEGLWIELDLGLAEVLLRVNPPGTPWHEDDLLAAARIRPAGLVLPKCEDSAAVAAVAARLEATPLFLMVETARGVLVAPELARAPHVAGLLFGAADFRANVRASREPDEGEILVARSALVLAARAAGIEVFDTPHFEYRDEAGLERSARRARALGFDGKTCIHPAQVAVVNRVFAPRAEEVERARKVVEALKAAEREGRGVATVDGEMVEALHGREARRTLDRACQAGTSPHLDIVKEPDYCSGKAAIGATRVRVNNVVHLHKQGRTVDEIRVEYPDLTHAQIYAALAYYHDHKDEIEADLSEDEGADERYERRRAKALAERHGR